MPPREDSRGGDPGKVRFMRYVGLFILGVCVGYCLGYMFILADLIWDLL